MSDSNTTILGLLLMETGGDTNTWGQNLNDQVIQYIEDKICGHTAVSTTGGSTTLTQAQCRARHLDVTGTLSSDATLVVPNTKNGWIINNATSGAFGLIVKTSGGSAACSVPQGTSKEVNCDGSNGVQRVDRNLAGELFYHAGAVPSGALECTGAAIKRTRAPECYASLGTTWGAGNGVDDFVLPDAYTAGKFLRSRTGSVTLGTAQTDGIASHVHANTATASTTTGTTDSDGAHSHTITITDPGHTHAMTNGAKGTDAGGSSNITQAASLSNGSTLSAASNTTGITASSNSTGSHTHTFTTTAATITVTNVANTSFAAETRPTNISAILCVRL